MARFVIQGGQQLSGSIEVLGSKNAALSLLAATLLTKQPVHLRNIPPLRDVDSMLAILSSMGAAVQRVGDTVTIQAQTIDPADLPLDVVGHLRGSILLMGALLGRFGTVELPHPGGDIIGARPIDVHLDAFRQLGATIHEKDTAVVVDARKARPGSVVLREFSVTATENVMLLAAQLPGVTTIDVAAAEPHVVALGTLLRSMGAGVEGVGTHTIIISGNTNLTGASYTNIPDMLEAGLFMLMAAATRSTVTVEQVPVSDLRLFFKKLDDIGVSYRIDEAAAHVHIEPGELRPFTMQSLPHPGIPTDLQAPFAVVATQASGSSLIHDPLYEDRFKHIAELQKMGAKAVVCDPHRVVVDGPVTLVGRKIPSLDIRSGATLIMAGLVAQGETVIEQAEIIERGYARLAERLKAIGANIRREEDALENDAAAQKVTAQIR